MPGSLPRLLKKTEAKVLQGFIVDNTKEEIIVYAIEAKAYVKIGQPHECFPKIYGISKGADKHNSIESFCVLMKRGCAPIT